MYHQCSLVATLMDANMGVPSFKLALVEYEYEFYLELHRQRSHI